MCPYEYYKEDEKYYPRLYCKIDNGYCFYSKRCQREERFIPLDNQKECYKYNMEKKKDIPNGSYFVQTYRKTKQGYIQLYVIIEDKIKRIDTKFITMHQDYVYLRLDKDNNYEVSLEPFKERNVVRKRTTKPKDE